MAHPDADELADLARQLGAQPDLDAVWDLVVHAALLQVEGAEHASITLLSRMSVSTPAATSDVVRELNNLQYAAGEGPCLAAALQARPVVRVDDLALDSRWPQFTEAAGSLGIHSMLSYQLCVGADAIGALNVYAARANAFSDDAVHSGTLLAVHVAVAAEATIKNAHLRAAVDSRDIIGQAKGILMNRHKITADQAFDLLIVASQMTNRKLRDVAADLTETGELATDHRR